MYDKNTGSLTGYADLEQINSLLMVAEQRFKDPVSNMQRPLAKCMLLIMVRELFNSLKFPYAQFLAASTKGAQLFPLLHQCVFHQTHLGLIVVSQSLVTELVTTVGCSLCMAPRKNTRL